MPEKARETLEVRDRAAWRSWLRDHHRTKTEIWLVFHKRHTGGAGVSYADALDEALCFGWIDSLVKRLDEDRYARKFTPRKAHSRWSTANRQRYAELEALGLLTAAGRARAPTDRSGDAPRPPATLPPYIERALRAESRAREQFEALAPSQRRTFVTWIHSAKREETRAKRLREAIAMLEAGKRLGLV